MKFKKIALVMLIVLALLAIASVPALAATNEKVILANTVKNSEGSESKEILIYYKNLCDQEFQFAISQNASAKVEELTFRNSAKDKASNEANVKNVAYIDENLFESTFGKNPTSQKAYVWIKDSNDNVVVEADEIDLNNAINAQILSIVENTTIANAQTNRIEIDTTQKHETHPEEEGIQTTVTTGKVVVKEKEGFNYYYSLIPIQENAKAKEMYELAEKMKTDNLKDTFERLSTEKRFYDLYLELIPQNWKKVENSEILQPETARTGDKYVVYIKEENKQNETTIDAKLLESFYDKEEQRKNEEDKVITEVVKLPVTFDSGAILFTILGIIVVALVVFVFIKVKSNKNNNEKK